MNTFRINSLIVKTWCVRNFFSVTIDCVYRLYPQGRDFVYCKSRDAYWLLNNWVVEVCCNCLLFLSYTLFISFILILMNRITTVFILSSRFWYDLSRNCNHYPLIHKFWNINTLFCKGSSLTSIIITMIVGLIKLLNFLFLPFIILYYSKSPM